MQDIDDATQEILSALAYEGELAIDTLAARTGIPHETINGALADDESFDVSALGDELVSVQLTDYGYRLARGVVGELAA